MKPSLPVVSAVAFASLAASIAAQPTLSDDVRSRWEASCMIRHDKFDQMLPGAMRRNDIDMWIVTDRGRGTQPMTHDFGISTVNGRTFFIFIDRGGDRIERIQLGRENDLATECGGHGGSWSGRCPTRSSPRARRHTTTSPAGWSRSCTTTTCCAAGW